MKTPFVITLTDLAGSEEEWRRFEREAIATPYQRFDWVRAYAHTMVQGGVSVAQVRAAGRLVAMLAIRSNRLAGLVVARPIGDKHANLNQFLVASDTLRTMDAQGMRSMLSAIGRAVRADIVLLPNCPVRWGDLPNPLAAHAFPSGSDALGLVLDKAPEALLARTASSQARKKLRTKERGLAELGAVAIDRATTPDDVGAVLEAFFAQKRRRFETLGIGDPYAGPDVQAFVRAGCLAGLAEGEPAIELHALRLDGKVVAVLGGAADRQRFAGMFISFDPEAPEARYSPGEILVAHTIAAQCRIGRAFFDLGVGEARYKRTFCDQTIELVDVVVPSSAAGRLAGAIVRKALAGKRRLKHSPGFMRGLAAMRRLKAGVLPR